MSGLVGLPELILLGLVLLLIFGPKRLPEMGRSLGHGMREFKESVTGPDREGPPVDGGVPRTAERREPEAERAA